MLFTCRNCTDKQKENRGCVSPVPHAVITVKECAICGGENNECALCKGKNRIEFYRCPVAMAKNASYLVHHLSRLREFGVYPNGSFSALKQSIPFVIASQIYDYYYNKFKAEYKP